jgi:hypothetical protein
MCENRKSIDEVAAIRDELSALIRLSRERFDEMRRIQNRIEEVTAEIARLTAELDQLGDGA